MRVRSLRRVRPISAAAVGPSGATFDAHFADWHAVVERFAADVLVERSSAALWRRLLDGVLVLAPEMPEPLRFSTPGEVLWAMLDQPCTFAELVDAWSVLYEISERTARAVIEPVFVAWCDGGAVVAARRSPYM